MRGAARRSRRAERRIAPRCGSRWRDSAGPGQAPDPVPAELLDRGWSEDDCARLAGGNVLRVMREAEAFSRATS